MLIKHCWKKNKIEKSSKDAIGFLLTNKLGSYLSLSNNHQNLSRYHGWFFTHHSASEKIFKSIENIELLNSGEILEIRNNFWKTERVYKNNTIENFFLPSNYNSLVYELNKTGTIRLFLDAKESYDNQEFGRFYEIVDEFHSSSSRFASARASKKNNIIIIKCQNNQNLFYLAIKTDQLNFSKIGEWSLRNYRLDQKRNSSPFQRYVYQAIEIKAQKIVFSVNFNKEKALKEVEEVFIKAEKLKERKEKETNCLLKEKISKGQKEINFAYLCAQNSLNNLVVANTENKTEGIYAGLPWFFQFWPRDELISLNSLDKKIKKRILLKYFNNLDKIYNLDALGWLFYRAGNGMMRDREINKLFFNLIDKFEILNANLTWMDTLIRPKGIELYALKLAMYKSAYLFSKDKNFLEKEKELLQFVRENFWNGKILADLPNNFIIRPNIFLVAYVYPELLSQKEWIICFKNALSKLWLGWGGLATIDKKEELFNPESTGENPKSYHNGDSWFWINNLTALVLTRLDKKRFQKYIEKILTASANEILWQGTIGHHGEISPANKLTSTGCWAQAWSNALYIELIENYYKK